MSFLQGNKSSSLLGDLNQSSQTDLDASSVVDGVQGLVRTNTSLRSRLLQMEQELSDARSGSRADQNTSDLISSMLHWVDQIESKQHHLSEELDQARSRLIEVDKELREKAAMLELLAGENSFLERENGRLRKKQHRPIISTPKPKCQVDRGQADCGSWSKLDESFLLKLATVVFAFLAAAALSWIGLEARAA